jgi:hypothetical protein
MEIIMNPDEDEAPTEVTNDLIDSLVEVDIIESDNFLKIKETLTRIGLTGRPDRVTQKPTLFQTSHILHKRGKFYIVHFKELFMLDGKPANFDEDDKRRRNTIITLLEKWGLLRVIDTHLITDVFGDNVPTQKKFRVISHAKKSEWNLVPKYNIGKYKSNRGNEE